MNCHSQIWTDSPMLEPVRESFRTDKSIEWARVHDLPDFVYFNHSVHVNKGVGCATCHGRVDQHAADVAGGVADRWSGAWTATATRSGTSGRASRSSTWPGSRRAGPARAGPRSSSQEYGIQSRAPAARRATDERRTPRRAERSTSPGSAAAWPARAGRGYWQSLEELAGHAGVPRVPAPRVPRAGRRSFDDPEGRRGFLQLMGASLALAGLAGCTRQPEEKIVPYVRAPEDIVPGRPLFFATARHATAATRTGVLVESHMGRPTKVEGNPEHPASLGATDAFAPGRRCSTSTTPTARRPLTHLGEIRTWGDFLAALQVARSTRSAPTQGRGPAHPDRDGHLADARARRSQALLDALPAGAVAPVRAGRPRQRARRRRARRSASAVRGRATTSTRPTSILALDADFLERGPGQPALRARLRRAPQAARRAARR